MGGCERRRTFWMKLLRKALSRWKEREFGITPERGRHIKGNKTGVVVLSLATARKEVAATEASCQFLPNLHF